MAEQAPNLSLDSLPPTPTPLSLDTVYAGHVSDDTAELRAAKATYGLSGVWGRTQDEVKQGIVNGQEEQLRREAASQLDSVATKNLTDAVRANPANALNLMQQMQPTDPKTVFEYSFAKRYTDLMYNLDSGKDYMTPLKEVSQVAPEASGGARRAATYLVAQGQVVQRYIKEFQDLIGQQSNIGYAADYLKGFIPGHKEFETRGAVPGVGFFEGGLIGENYRKQYEKLLGSRNIDEFNDTLEVTMAPFRSNPQSGLQFLHDLFDYSTSARWMNNIGELTSVAVNLGALPAGYSVAKALILRTEENAALKRVAAKAGTVEEAPIHEAAAAAAGDLGTAATKKVARQLTFEVTGPASHEKEALERLQQANRLDAQSIRDNPGNYGTERANRLADKTEGWLADFLERLRTALKVERVPIARLAEPALKALDDEVDKQYNGMDNQILNRGLPFHNNLTNTWHRNIFFGDSRAKLFESKVQAENAASDLPGAKTFGEGNKWGFYVTQPIPESGISRIEIPGAESPLGFINAFATWLRTPEDTLSRNQNILRKVATYAPSMAFKEIQKQYGALRKLSSRAFKGTEGKARFDRWYSIVKEARNHWDPSIPKDKQGPENRGYFYQSPGEFEQAYALAHPGHLPTDLEVEAYFANKGILEAERAINNIRIYKQLNALGAEKFRFFQGSTSPLDAAKNYTEWFNAIKKNTMPTGDEPLMVVYGGDKGSESIHQRGSTLQGNRRKEIEKGLTDGTWYHLEVVDAERRPFRGWSKDAGERKITHVLVQASSVERNALDFEQIPRRGGGHFDYDYPHWLKVADVREEKWGETTRHRYEGDIPIMPVKVHAEGVDLARRLNEVRVLIQQGKDREAEALWDTFNNKGWSFNDFAGNYKQRTQMVNGVKRTLKARLNINEPITLVTNNMSIWDMGPQELQNRYMSDKGGLRRSTLTNDTKVGMMRGLTITEHSKMRDGYDMVSPKNEGSVANPVYNYHPAEMVDPIPSINRAMAKAITGLWMDDYKINSMLSWVQEGFKRGLFSTSENELKNSPFWYFNHPEYAKGADPYLVTQFKANNFKIREFNGYRHVTDIFLDSMAQRLSDMAYQTVGPNKARLIPTWLLAHSNEVIATARSIVFNLAMGLFSLPQYALHAWTFINVMGIAGPGKAMQGALGSLLHGFAYFNKSEGMLNFWDNVASKMGIFKPGEWKEAYTLLERNGFHNEYGEYQLKDSALTAKVIRSNFGQFLDYGQMFFRGGVKTLRTASWYTAYKEFRGKTPRGAISDFDHSELLNRADLFSHNMSRASGSSLNSGVASIPFQFFSYFLRLSEMMWSGGLFGNGRLTRMEKLRLFGVNAAVFGVPAALGLTGFPLEDYIRKSARDHGYQVGDNFISSFLMEGGASAIWALVEGRGDWTKGDWLNFSERFGPGKGWEGIDKILQTDKGYWELVSGAVGSKMGETLSNVTNFTKAVYAGITQDPAYFPASTEMLIDILREANSFNYAYTGYISILTGKLHDKRGESVGNISAAKALLLASTGLKDRRFNDLYGISQQIQHQTQVENYFEKKFNVEWDRWVQALKDNNLEEARSHYMTAFGILEAADISYYKRAQIIQRASVRNKDLIDAIPDEYYRNWRKIPPSQVQTRSDADRRRSILQRGQQ